VKPQSLFIAILVFGLNVTNALAERIRAEDYQEYWLWAGVRHRSEFQKANTIYLLQGEIAPAPAGGAYVKFQGGAQPGPHSPSLWLVYRVRSLDWGPEVIAAIKRRLALWRAQPGVVNGIQLDFDASTHNLTGYATFLRDIRKSLPADCRLSITGLMDWASQAMPEDLDHLSHSVDEMIFQTYRGHQTVNEIESYLKRLDRLHIPFKLGLAEGAEWRPQGDLQRNPYFNGYVIFLQNHKY
jgi:hypothetical protein